MRKGSEVTLHHPSLLRVMRCLLGLSQEALADGAGVSSGFIALIETDRRSPSRENADAMVAFLNKCAEQQGCKVDIPFEALFTYNGAQTQESVA